MTSWIIFAIAVLFSLLIDLGLHSNKERPPLSHALFWSAFWIFLALTFNIWIYIDLGQVKALQFLTSYVVEKSLSVDNLFVFLIIFKSFSIPSRLRHKVLFWGVLGAIVMRAIFIAGGIALVNYFSFALYIFGAFLIYTAFKIAFKKDNELHPEQNRFLLWFEKKIPIDSSHSTDRFFIKKNHVWYATPLFLALLAVEISDVIFALDSIPAVLGITTDPLIVFTSNIFAILGLRSLYFALEQTLEYFHYLHYGLAIILGFIGLKMLLADFWHVPIGLSLSFIAATLFLSMVASLIKPKPIK